MYPGPGVSPTVDAQPAGETDEQPGDGRAERGIACPQHVFVPRLCPLPMIPQGRLTIVAALLGLAVLAVLLVIVPGTVGGFDGQSMLQVTQSIVERGDVTVHG